MLRVLREGAKSGIIKFILFGFLVMAVGGLVLMDVQGFFRGGVTRTTVAKIDGDELGAMTFDRIVRRVLSRQNLPAAQAYQFGFINQILESEITNNLIQKDALELGLYVSDEQIAQQINDIITPLVTEDMPKKEALRRILMSQGMTEKEFIQAIRGETINNLLRNAIQTSTALTLPQEARDIYMYENEKRSISAILLPNSAIKDIPPAEEEVLKALYEAGKERYAIPEMRTFSILLLSEDLLKDTLDISEEELKESYEDNIEAFKLPEQRVIEQAIVSTQNAANNIKAKLEKGAPLKAALEEETGSDEGYMGEETFQKEGLTEEIAEAVFDANTGDITGPVQTALGWHIMVVHDILPPSTQSYEDARKSIKDDMMQVRLMDQMFALANNVDDELAGGAALEDVSKELNVKVQTIGPVRYDGSTPDEKDAMVDFENDREYIMDTVFEIIEGETAPVMELSDGRFAVIRTDEVREKDYVPYEALKTQLSEIWMNDKREIENKQRAQDLLRRLQKEEITLEQAAKENNVKIETLKNVKRSDPASEKLPAAAKTAFFDIPEGSYAVSPVSGGFMIGKVTSVKLPDPAKIMDEELAKLRDTEKREIQDEFLMMYLDNLRQSHKVVINQRLLDQMYGPGSEQQF